MVNFFFDLLDHSKSITHQLLNKPFLRS